MVLMQICLAFTCNLRIGRMEFLWQVLYLELKRKLSKQSVQGNHLEGDTKTSSIYETVRSEVRRAISKIQTDFENAMRRSNTPPLETADIADIPPDLVNPSAIELVLDIRREYAKKLEQSQERARKLQSDLTVEEHRGQELSRILKEVLPDPKTSNLQKSRPGRKDLSIEDRSTNDRHPSGLMAGKHWPQEASHESDQS